MSRRGNLEPLGRKRESFPALLPDGGKQSKKYKLWVGCWSGPDTNCALIAYEFSLHSVLQQRNHTAKQGCPAPPHQSISAKLGATSRTCQLCTGSCLSPWRDAGGNKASARAEHGQEGLFKCASILWHGGAVCLSALGSLSGMPWGGKEPTLSQTS